MMPSSHLRGSRRKTTARDGREAVSERPAAHAGRGLFVAGLWGGDDSEQQDPEASVCDEPGEDLSDPGRRKPAAGAVWSGRLQNGRRKVSRKPFRGSYARPVAAAGSTSDLAWDATLKAAAPRQAGRRPAGAGPSVRIRAGELQRKLRLIRPGRLLLFLVDISGSMGGRHMELARKVSAFMLVHAYVRRDHLAMVAFRNRSAELVVPPTHRAERVRDTLAGLPCGGLTPLGRGLTLARNTLGNTLRRNPGLQAFLVLISDARANVGPRPGSGSMREEIEWQARGLAGLRGLKILFLDTTEEGKRDTDAVRLSRDLRAQRFRLWRLLRSGRDPAVEIARAVR